MIIPVFDPFELWYCLSHDPLGTILYLAGIGVICLLYYEYPILAVLAVVIWLAFYFWGFFWTAFVITVLILGCILGWIIFTHHKTISKTMRRLRGIPRNLLKLFRGVFNKFNKKSSAPGYSYIQGNGFYLIADESIRKLNNMSKAKL